MLELCLSGQNMCFLTRVKWHRGPGKCEARAVVQARRREQTRLSRIDEQDKQARKLAEHQVSSDVLEFA